MSDPIGATGSGAITATFTWQPDGPGDDPPKSVIIQRYSSVISEWEGVGPQGGSDDGLGGSPNEADIYDGHGYTIIWSACASTNWKVKSDPGASFTETCSPSAGYTGEEGQDDGVPENYFQAAASADITYRAAAYPVNLTLSGTTQDTSSGSTNILIGQGCTGNLTAGPATLSNYSWSVPGDTFANFEMGTTPGTMFTSGKPYGHVNDVDPSEYQKPSPHWYWKKGTDSGDEKTVSCTATATPPTGEGDPFTVTAEKKVKVWRPSDGFRPSAGDVYAMGDNSVIGNIDFHGAVGTPDLFKTYWGDCGVWQPTQLCDIERTSMTYIGWPKNVTTDGLVLDAEFNYASSQISQSDPAPWPADSTADVSDEKLWSDAPQSDVSYCVSAICGDTFNTYMMYQPPGPDSQWVPLHKCVWNWQVNMNRTWSLGIDGIIWGLWTPTPPGSVSVSDDSDTSTFPSWTDVYTP